MTKDAHIPQQLDFESLMFSEDRTVLYVSEVAKKLKVTEQHIVDLIEEGSLQAVSVGGEFDSIRVPKECVELIAQHCGRSAAEIRQLICQAKAMAAARPGRQSWRIPVEGWEDFLKRRHSFSQGAV